MINSILEYYQAIVNGSVTVGKWVRLWYEFIVKGLEDKSFFFDQKKANHAIKFIERHCRHHEGSLAPNLIKLELWQKALISVMFGIIDEKGNRQFREVFVVIGRKNGKTLLAAAIAAYMAYMDGEYGARIYFCAPKLDQARLCYEGFYQTILKDTDMSAMAKKRRTDIYIAESNTSAQPLAFSAKKSDGLNPQLTVCDEVAAWQGDAGLKQYEVIKSALGARRQPLVLSISTANFISDGIYDELVKRSTAVIMGTSKERRLAPFLYIIDDAEKWNDINELQKSLPNLGVSVSVDYMLEEISVAEGSLSKKAEFLTKYCNIKQSSSTAWLSTQALKKCFSNDYTPADFRHTYAVGGVDLSRTTDLTAACLVVERDDILYFFTHFWLPSSKKEEATARDGLPYEIYEKRGFLTFSDGEMVDYMDVETWFESMMKQYEILPVYIGYDKAMANYFVSDMERKGFRLDDVRQGFNLSSTIDDVEGRIKGGQLQCADDNDLMKVHMMDVAVQSSEKDKKRMIAKIARNSHIDGVAALLDAVCMRHAHWNEIGAQISNKR